jgi:heme exporter protein C
MAVQGSIKIVGGMATAILFAGACLLTAFWTPTEANQGEIQKIFYMHLPVAINALLACALVFVASVGFLWTRQSKWDDLAASAAGIAVLLCTVVLITGMCWARGAWGAWWVWSPRLVFSLILWLLYVVYVVVRNSIESLDRRALVSAVYGTLAFLDVPLVWLSARMMPDIHPGSVSLTMEMKLTLAAWFVPVTMLTAMLIALHYRVNRIAQPLPESPAELPVLPEGHLVGGHP